MTRSSAIVAMIRGKKVRHRFFSSDEWVKMNPDGNYEFEDGVVCSPELFWKDRSGELWYDDWVIVDEL